MRAQAALAAVAFFAAAAEAYYLPGVAPINYDGGASLPLKVSSMTSTTTELPYDFYSLAYCKPSHTNNENDNLGEFLTGERIEKSAYRIFVMKPEQCKIVCKKVLSKDDVDLFASRITTNYLNHWIVDNMPSASVSHRDGVKVIYEKGFPVGYASKDGATFLYNHHSITLSYHEVSEGHFRIVGFRVEPFSVKHEFQYKSAVWEGYDPEDAPPFSAASCPSSRNRATMQQWKPLMLERLKGKQDKQEVIFTYDVIWESSDQSWASRWDVYLESDVSPKVHWLAISNSLLVVLLMTGMIVIILVRALRRDLYRYSRVPTDEDKADMEEDRGWKLVHGDVFRPPQRGRLLLCLLLGAGAQVLLCMLMTIVFSAMGFLSPAYRGSYIIGALFSYVLASLISGYVTALFFKNFGGLAWKYATFLAAFLLPSLLFGIFLVMNLTLSAYGSSGAVPFSKMVLLIFLWFFVSVPLTCCGSYAGFKQRKWQYPMSINLTRRPIPEGPLVSKGWVAIVFGGLLPFGACFTELYFIMSSVWANNYYYMFGFLALILVILIITCAEVAILGVYFQLSAENWAWWWRAFLTPAMAGAYTFLYSIWYWSRLDASMPVTYFLYFGYMLVACSALAIACGFVGVVSSLVFVIKIYSSIKVE
uniref:Transmembrane 9 superfamily member n=1 Tax=Phaeomonas parva TaxID=124430 RepID=A0A7S1XWN7_9STRA|mmetsp:Transcript_4644/g.13221  ORF Transcript_4644/g.13221 Transcript_4644/m.13221 type:complete len:646 (+) Transcript_4644:200-2137(+)